MRKVLEIEINKTFEKEKDIYPFLKAHIFQDAVKLYTPILKGFPDFIVTSFKSLFVKSLRHPELRIYHIQ